MDVDLILAVIAAVVPPAVVLGLWLHRVGWRSDPPAQVALATAFGAGAFGIAVAVEYILPATHADGASWYRAFIEAGPREEVLVLLAALIAAPFPTRWSRSSSGITWLLAAAAGFAGAESIVYGLQHGLQTTIARAFTATPAHLLQGIVIGLGAGRIHRALDPRRGWGALILGLWIAILCHGTYDFLLLAGGSGRFSLPLFLALEATVVGVAVISVLRRDQNDDLLELGRIKLLADARVPGPALREMAVRCARRSFRKGSLVVSEGDEGQSLYVLTRGTLGVRRGGKDVAKIARGGLVGEVAVLTGTRRTADIVALEDSFLLELPRSALLAAIARTDGLAEALLTSASRRGYIDLPSPESLEEEARRAGAAVLQGAELGPLAQHLRGTPLFSRLSDRALASLVQHVEVERALAGRRIVREGSAGDALYVLMAGTVVVRHDGQDLARMGPGQFFGEIGLLTGRQATADVRAVTDCDLVSLDWAGLRAVVGVHPEVGLSLLSAVLHRTDALKQAGADQTDLSVLGRLERLVQPDDVSDIDSTDSLADYRDAFGSAAILDVPTLLALRAAAGQGGTAEWAYGPNGVRRVRDGRIHPGEHGLSSRALAEALARSPDVLRALASQALV